MLLGFCLIMKKQPIAINKSYMIYGIYCPTLFSTRIAQTKVAATIVNNANPALRIIGRNVFLSLVFIIQII